jgi:hypothetical protein
VIMVVSCARITGIGEMVPLISHRYRSCDIVDT